MRLLSVRLKNYRLHSDLQTDFAGDLSLIHGPNESGKSTLVEAIHRALFYKHNAGGEVQKNMLSRQGGHPVVELEFEAGGKRYHLAKEFNGNKGTATLACAGSAQLSGDQAEEHLSALLRVHGVLGGKQAGQLPNRWAHLWVWQGASDGSPLAAVGESHDTLREKLQERVGAGLSASSMDNRLIAKLQKLHDETFTAGGKPKTGSALHSVNAALEDARNRLAEREKRLDDLGAAATEFSEAEEAIRRHAQDVADARSRLKLVADKLKDAAALQQSQREKQRLKTEAESKLEDLRTADTRIRQLRAKLESDQAKAAPAATEIQTLQEEVESLRGRLASADARVDATANAVTLALAQKERLEAHLALLGKRHQLAEVLERRQKIAAVQKNLLKAKEAATRLERFSDRALKDLRKKEQAASSARAHLEAYALRLEVLRSGIPVQVGEDTVEEGKIVTLTEPTEVRLGEATQLRLTPGGSKDLDAARADDAKASRHLSNALRELGVVDYEEAEQKARERSQCETERDKLNARMNDLEPDRAEELQTRLREEMTRLEALRDKSVEGLPPVTYQEDVEAAASALEESRIAHDKANAEATAATREQRTLRTRFGEKTDLLESRRTLHQSLEAELLTLRNNLQFEEQRWGDQATRNQKILEAQANFDQTKLAESKVAADLAALGVADLELDQKRFTKSIANGESLLEAAKEKHTRARTHLERGETTDPESDVKEALADLERLKQNAERHRRQAEARRLLLDQLKSAQRRITETLSAPLEDAAAPYLESLFGQGSRAHLKWSEDGGALEGLAIERSREFGGYFDFESLSHGTREQVGLALRLAMAQLLASDHGGCLPLVLDDAFTHADKDRIQRLQRLLFRAAENGLQIILLSCHPENYTGLTAHEISLRRLPAPSQTGAPLGAFTASAPGDGSPAEDAVSGFAPETGRLEAFVAALQGLGGKAGNTTLRQALAWDEATYESVKQSLITQGEIETGRGRGGSVRLLDADSTDRDA